MRKLIKTGLAVLDGQPTNMKGQSLAELTITLPIFLIMLVGMVEVGWFANNYLILSDVVRAAGRNGSLNDPTEWVPGEERNYHRLDCDNSQAYFSKLPDDDTTSPPTDLSAYGYSTSVESPFFGFYDGVACAAIANMAPLEFDDEVDDIIVSVFGYAQFEDCGGGDPCLRVVSRFPHEQNECSDDTRDPFSRPAFITGTWELGAFEDSGADGIRGYVFRGNHVPENDGSCLGSNFSLQWLEERLELTLTDLDRESPIDTTELEFLSAYGLVLVEMSWHSEQLIGLPLYSWIGDPIRIHVWSIFPVSAAEPDL